MKTKILADFQICISVPLKEISGKSQNFFELQPSAQYYSQNENFVKTSKKLLEK